MSESVELSVIIVTYNTRHHVLECLRSIYDHLPSLKMEVIVVDNGSSDGTVEAIQQLFPKALVIANSDNLGPAAARNQALERARGNFILFLDADTRLTPGCIEHLLLRLNGDHRVGAIGPQLIGVNGESQMHHGQMPTLLTEFCYWTFISGLFRHVSWIPRHHQGTTGMAAMKVGWIATACCMTRAEVVERAGRFDQELSYMEDVEWCWRVRRQGYDVVYDPTARVVHFGDASGALWSPRILTISQAPYLLFRKCYGTPMSWLLRIMYLIGLSIRVFVFRLGWLFTRNPILLSKAVWNQRMLLANFGVVSSIPRAMLPSFSTPLRALS